jgi:hypothetical protein
MEHLKSIEESIEKFQASVNGKMKLQYDRGYGEEYNVNPPKRDAPGRTDCHMIFPGNCPAGKSTTPLR